MASFRRALARMVMLTPVIAPVATGCMAPLPTEAQPFALGTWSDPATGAELVLDTDGTGYATGIQYVPNSERGSCDPRDVRDTFSGPIAWVKFDDGSQFVLQVKPVETSVPVTVSFGSRRYSPEDWSRILQWPCGDPDVAPAQLLKWESTGGTG